MAEDEYQKQAKAFFDEKDKRDKARRKKSMRFSLYLFLGALVLLVIGTLAKH